MFAPTTRERQRYAKQSILCAAPDRRITQPSMIVPLLFEGFDPSVGVRALDLGSARSETVDFFAQYKCRLSFVDLLGELAEAGIELDADSQKFLPADREILQKLLLRLLAPAVGGRFDLCLMWDVLNYLNDAELALLDATLIPLLQPGTRMHAFGFRCTDADFQPRQYGIAELRQICVSPMRDTDAHGRAGRARALTPQLLQKRLPSMELVRGTLMQDGRIEMLLRPKSG